MTTRKKKLQPRPVLDSRLYSTAQIAAAEGRLPADHPLWREDSGDEGEQRREQILKTQETILPYITSGATVNLPTLIRRVTGLPSADAMHSRAWQIRRAIWAWYDERRIEWVDGCLDEFRLLAPPRGGLTTRRVSPVTAAKETVFGCPCGRRWTGLGIAHCATCHLTFMSVTGFDEHRFQGRCRTSDELRKRGLEPNDADHWRRPMSDEDRDRMP